MELDDAKDDDNDDNDDDDDDDFHLKELNPDTSSPLPADQYIFPQSDHHRFGMLML